uniref:Sodefrin-like factor n=1 Tax=Notophthalmus viridescens TaxID=8316 RepID=A0A0E3N2L5_NOTVI|nr:sodefrin precursor-like factor [Notophthalmus viridescens]
MKALLVSISILFAFISRGESLSCEQCMNLNGTTCSGNQSVCEGYATRCDNTYMEFTRDGQTTSTTFKGCAVEQKCTNYFLSENLGDFQFRMQKSYCEKDNCNTRDLVVPPRNNTPNGVRCPKCYAENATSCQSYETMECTGLETKCMDFGGKIRKFDQILTIASMNCVNEEPCKRPILYCSVGLAVEIDHFRCSDGEKYS